MSCTNMAASLPNSIYNAITQYPSEQYLNYHQYHPNPHPEYYRMEYLKENDFMNTDVHNTLDDYSDPGSCYSESYDNATSMMSIKDESNFYSEPLYKPEELFQCPPLSQVFASDMPSHDPARPPQKKKPGRKKGQTSKVLHLWEFIRDLLKDPKFNGSIIQWENREEGVFRVVKSSEVATLWGQKKKNKKEMTYEKMSRSMRYSRKEGYFIDLPKNSGYPKKLCFRFGPKSTGWQ
ncbi:ETS homologous factor-like isoform X4 [Haliotis rufescens]|uniref:ETS homologous factor-like isoform X4 n=1 Tax=Haliotis rufescens TaxID=6454 RepID=UPI001EB03412|nr:ETS homologous factor-like isoform X4 [Haliotis rufescens]